MKALEGRRERDRETEQSRAKKSERSQRRDMDHRVGVTRLWVC